jgi:hypothetical protein
MGRAAAEVLDTIPGRRAMRMPSSWADSKGLAPFINGVYTHRFVGY